MKPLFFLVATVILIGTACQRNYYYQPANNQPENTQLVYNHGVPSLRSMGSASEVSVDLTSRGQKMLNLGVFIRNQSDSFQTFFPDQVRVFGYNAAGQRKPFKVFSAEQFIRRRNTRNAIIAGVVVAATVTAAVAAADASSNASNNWDDDNDEFQNNWWWYAWSTPAPIVVVNANNNFGNLPLSSPDGLVRTQTLYAGESLQGLIKVQSIPGFTEKIVVEIPMEGSAAKFMFDDRQRRF